jgi:hypothetical protein
MKLRNVRLIGTVALFFSAFGAAVSAQTTLRIGTASGKQGQSVVVQVTLTATTSHTAALVRVQYNAAVLELPAVTSGPLLSRNHALDCNSPTAGRFNVAAYAPSAMPSFTAKSGTLFNLTFKIKPTAPAGVSPIAFTTIGTPALPSADLVGITGGVVTPTATAGSVTVGVAGVGGPWTVYE